MRAMLLAGSLIFLALLIISPATAQAPLPKLDDSPIELEADSAEFLHDRRSAIYRGNVLITQGKQLIRGDSATISYNEENQIEYAIIVGAPASWERESPQQEKSSGEAKNIEYFISEDRILLSGEAKINTERGSLSGEKIEYNTITGNANVTGGGNAAPDNAEQEAGQKDDERVRVIFKPPQDKQ